MSFFGKFKPGASTTSPNTSNSPKAKDANLPPATPLGRMLEHAGPIRNDGSDKFWGMENFGNTCYCNSILQCLYFSAPFRENVLNYPRRSSVELIDAASKTAPPRPSPPSVSSSQTSGAVKKPMVPSSPRLNAGPTTVQKPEDKDSPEYKKKQALAAGPILNLSYDNAEAYDMPESLFSSLKDIFEAVVVSDKRSGVVSPIKFLEVLRKENEMFRSAMHQDAHEFLILLLNALVECIEAHDKQLKAAQAKSEEREGGLGDRTDSGTVSFPAMLSEPRPRSAAQWLTDLFEGTLTSETRCLSCENTSQRDEPFLDLSVDLEQHSSVTACLRRFSEEEMLCERNKFHCDNCGGLQEAEKRMKIKRLPKVLALHLKRFKYTEDLQRLQKLFHKVVYPYHLRLFNTTDDAEGADRIYELYAVVVHIGGGPYHGHYVAIIKTQDRGWLLFDDELVEPVDRSYVRNFFGDKAGMACAYVLFYQETSLDAIQREQRMEGRRRQSQDASVGLGLDPTNNHNDNEDATDLHRVYSSPAEGVDEAGFANLAHAATAPAHALNSHADLPHPPPNTVPSAAGATGPPTSQAVLSRKEKHKEEKARKAAEKQAEKDRAHAEKQAEKDRVQAEKDRRQALSEKMTETRKRQEAELKAALEASKVSKSEEDKRRGAADANLMPNGSLVNALSASPNSSKSGLDVFRRSKSLRFGSLAKRDREKERSHLAANDQAASESTSAVVDEDREQQPQQSPHHQFYHHHHHHHHHHPPQPKDKERDKEKEKHKDKEKEKHKDKEKEKDKDKEKRNRFSLRKKSFGMLS